jgi:hypothetical protein
MHLRRFCLVAACFMSSIRGAMVEVSPANLTAAVDQTFGIDVAVTSMPDLYAFQFDLTFNPSVLEATSVSEGSFLSTGGPTLFFPGSIDNVAGVVSTTADTLEGTAGVSGSGLLAHFTFQTIGAGTTGINIQNLILLDSSLSGINAGVSNGNLTVALTPEPSYQMPLLCCIGLLGFVGLRVRSRSSCGGVSRR